MVKAHLARVDSLAGERVVVGSHLVAGVLFKATRWLCVVDRWELGESVGKFGGSGVVILVGGQFLELLAAVWN